ncbi:MAG: chloride channel protein [Rhodospirillales bacterium]|jgi:CIC family chloride channel protein|nr:chloride channel protein [Rhodospirillales bacterium]
MCGFGVSFATTSLPCRSWASSSAPRRGGAIIGFREAIGLFQTVFFTTGSERLYLYVQNLPWWRVLLAPAVGGLIVGALVHRLMPGQRPQAVADVIEAAALRGGRMSARNGMAAALISAVSLGVGASAGREGPAVHLGATFGGWLADRLHLTRSNSRTLLGCGVAAAVAASFNAPIAGALFATEVVVGHYALRAFAPIVIASVTGTVISRVYFGDFPAFALTHSGITSIWEYPAFLGLGVASAITAIAFMRGVGLAAAMAEKSRLPVWLRPAAAGLAIGALAIAFPQVLGVGYGATEAALKVVFPFWLLVALLFAKVAATALCLGFRFGGGVFSPSLVIGAMLGGAYGFAVTALMPALSSGPGAYTIVGMGAVASAVLGAPISTTLIIFEMTGDYALTVAVMVAVVVASVITQNFYGQSFFAKQLEQRGYDLKEGFESALLRALDVSQVMAHDSGIVRPETNLPTVRARLQASAAGQLFVVDEGGRLFGTITLADLSEAAFDQAVDTLINAGDVARPTPSTLTAGDDLETALKLFRSTGEPHIAVVEDADTLVFLGCVHERDVMNAYNRALVESRREERGG